MKERRTILILVTLLIFMSLSLIPEDPIDNDKKIALNLPVISETIYAIPNNITGNSTSFSAIETNHSNEVNGGILHGKNGGTTNSFNISVPVGWDSPYINVTISNISLALNTIVFQDHPEDNGSISASSVRTSLAQEFEIDVSGLVGNSFQLTKFEVLLWDFSAGESFDAYIYDKSASNPNVNITRAFTFQGTGATLLDGNFSHEIQDNYPILSGGVRYFLVLNYTSDQFSWKRYNDGSNDGMTTQYFQSGSWETYPEAAEPIEFVMNMELDPIDPCNASDYEMNATANGLDEASLSYVQTSKANVDFHGIQPDGNGDVTISFLTNVSWDVQFDYEYTIITSGGSAPINGISNDWMYSCIPNGDTSWKLHVKNVEIGGQNDSVMIPIPNDWVVDEVVLDGSPWMSSDIERIENGLVLNLPGGTYGDVQVDCTETTIRIPSMDNGARESVAILQTHAVNVQWDAPIDASVTINAPGNVSFFLFHPSQQDPINNTKKINQPTGVVNYDYAFKTTDPTGDYELVAVYTNGTSTDALKISIPYRHVITLSGDNADSITITGNDEWYDDSGALPNVYYVQEGTPYDVRVSYDGNIITRGEMVFDNDTSLVPIFNFNMDVSVVDKFDHAFDVRIQLHDAFGDNGILYNQLTGVDGNATTGFSRISKTENFTIKLLFKNGSTIDEFDRLGFEENVTCWNFTIGSSDYVDGHYGNPIAIKFKVGVNCSQWYASSNGDDDDPNDNGLDLLILYIIVVAISVAGIGIVVGIKKKRGGKKDYSKYLIVEDDKVKAPSFSKSEEKKVYAEYFQDATSIHAILAIHKEQGTCLSKTHYLLGEKLQEDLLTGLLSALTSIETELANQMEMVTKKGEGKNEFKYGSFTITVIEGQYMNLAVVSDKRLEGLMTKRCTQLIDVYETKKHTQLRFFKGSVSIFKDFPPLVKRRLDGALNTKSRINVDRLETYDAPKKIVDIYRKMHMLSEEFLPEKIPVILQRELKMKEQDALYQAYHAYTCKIFIPIQEDAKPTQQN